MHTMQMKYQFALPQISGDILSLMLVLVPYVWANQLPNMLTEAFIQIKSEVNIHKQAEQNDKLIHIQNETILF